MDQDLVWRHIDTQRARFADLCDDLTPAEWETASLCAGWRVRDVAAHLTLSQTGAGRATVELAARECIVTWTGIPIGYVAVYVARETS